MRWFKGIQREVLLLIVFALLMWETRTVSAASWVEFHPPSAAAGEVVEARAYGFPASSSLAVFLAPKAVANSIQTPDDARLIPLGKLTVAQSNEGRLRFVVPNLSPAVYQGLIHCESCASTRLLPGDYFRITAPVWQSVGIVATVAGLFLIAVSVWRRHLHQIHFQ